jgi:hypothetical protein
MNTKNTVVPNHSLQFFEVDPRTIIEVEEKEKSLDSFFSIIQRKARKNSTFEATPTLEI